MARPRTFGKNQQFRKDGNTTLIIPCANGAYAWVASPSDTRMFHVATDSEEFTAKVGALVTEGFEARVRELLDSYGWERQLAFLTESGAFSPAEATEAA